MNKLLLGILFSISLPILLGSAQEAYAAVLVLDDTVEDEITIAHDPNWELGVTSNGTPFGPFVSGSTTVPGEVGTFVGTYFVNSGGNPDPGSGVIFFVDECTGLVSDKISASWSTVVGPFPFDTSTIDVLVESSPDGGDLGILPAGFEANPETVFIGITGLFEDPATGNPVSIPSNLAFTFRGIRDECPIVAGELMSLNTGALLLGGLATSAFWIVPIGAAAAGTGIYIAKTRLAKDEN